jgi:hypothetical protein
MSADPRQIATIHLTTDAPGGGTLAIVTYSDGDCGISRDGQPIPEYTWPANQMRECTQAFLRLAGLR